MLAPFMPHVGKVYMVKHNRKGSFTIRVSKVAPDWIDGELVSGDVVMRNESNNVAVGETVSLRRAFISGYMEIVEPPSVPAPSPDPAP